ncbi:MAG: RHS repeat-associated core domain-containing protein [Candidatus Acidiferrum sp.]
MVADPTAGATYTYDGNGTRVQKWLPNCTNPSSSTVFVFSGSQDIAEYDNGAVPASPSREFVYSDGLPGAGLLATLTGGPSPTITYFHDDHLSWRISTDGTPGSPTYGQVNGSQGSYPFGDSWYSSNGNEFAFTSYQRDSESGLDYAMARYYDSTAGRFCSADPVGGQINDPQTWDRYSYVRNDPINLTDPNGQSWLSWLVDGIIAALAIALPEIDPALFSFMGETTTVTTATQTAVETASINGQIVGSGMQISKRLRSAPTSVRRPSASPLARPLLVALKRAKFRRPSNRSRQRRIAHRYRRTPRVPTLMPTSGKQGRRLQTMQLRLTRGRPR